MRVDSSAAPQAARSSAFGEVAALGGRQKVEVDPEERHVGVSDRVAGEAISIHRGISAGFGPFFRMPRDVLAIIGSGGVASAGCEPVPRRATC